MFDMLVALVLAHFRLTTLLSLGEGLFCVHLRTSSRFYTKGKPRSYSQKRDERQTKVVWCLWQACYGKSSTCSTQYMRIYWPSFWVWAVVQRPSDCLAFIKPWVYSQHHEKKHTKQLFISVPVSPTWANGPPWNRTHQATSLVASNLH